MNHTITLGGASHNVAPLKALQAAEFLQRTPEGTVENVRNSLRIIGIALRNANAPLIDGIEQEDGIIRAVNNAATDLADVEEAFVAVLDISRLRKKDAGEAVAAALISSESSAAS